MKTIVITCDVCGVQKKEANHWFLWADLASPDSLVIHKWDDGTLDGFKHLCGEACVQKKVSEFCSRK